MKHASTLITAACLLIACWIFWPEREVPLQPAGEPIHIRPLASLLPDEGVRVADTLGRVRVVRVARPERVAAAVTVKPDSVPVQLLIDASKPRWFPEAKGLRANIRVRSLDPDQADRVIVVQQRMPFIQPELRLYAGAGWMNGMVITGGASVLRLWIVHVGMILAYQPRAPGLALSLGPALSIEPRERLSVGLYIDALQLPARSPGLVVAYRF